MVIIEHTNTIIYCRRWRETVAFYERSLGLPVLMRRHWFVEFRLGTDATLSVADMRRATIASAGGAGLTVSLRVTDAPALRDELVRAGVPADPVRAIWGSDAFFVRDPEGTRLEFWSPGRPTETAIGGKEV